jgi:hypothetical protein
LPNGRNLLALTLFLDELFDIFPVSIVELRRFERSGETADQARRKF